MSAPCELCLVNPAAAGDVRCVDCARWDDHWRSLTPAERRAEERMMAAYVDDDGRP